MRLPCCPGQQAGDFPGTGDPPAGSTFQSSSQQGSCQPTFAHSATHHFGETLCEATRCLLSCMSLRSDREQMFGSLCVSGQSQETQCEGQTQVRLGVKNCGHMIHPDQVFRTSWATSGYLWEQGTDLQGSGSGSAVTWYSLWFTWAVLFSAKWLQAIGLIRRHTFCLCLMHFCVLHYLFFFFFFFLHGFAC